MSPADRGAHTHSILADVLLHPGGASLEGSIRESRYAEMALSGTCMIGPAQLRRQLIPRDLGGMAVAVLWLFNGGVERQWVGQSRDPASSERCSSSSSFGRENQHAWGVGELAQWNTMGQFIRHYRYHCHHRLVSTWCPSHIIFYGIHTTNILLPKHPFSITDSPHPTALLLFLPGAQPAPVPNLPREVERATSTAPRIRQTRRKDEEHEAMQCDRRITSDKAKASVPRHASTPQPPRKH